MIDRNVFPIFTGPIRDLVKRNGPIYSAFHFVPLDVQVAIALVAIVFAALAVLWLS